MRKKYSMMLGGLLAFVSIVASPAIVDAQRITDLVQGTRVRVETNNSGVIVGRLESGNPDSIRVAGPRETRVFSLAETKSVFISTGRSASRGMLRTGVATGVVGALIGAGIGAMTFKPCEPGKFFDCRYVPNTRSRATTFGAVVFGASSLVIGGLVGAIRGGEAWAPVTVR